MNNIENLSPMMQQYLQLKKQYEDCILFYRVGDFYEMFYDDAILVSKELELTLTGKDCSVENRAPMCGVPYHAYETYAQKLIEKGYKVAICEQMAEAKPGIKLVPREVIRIITPGTVVDSSMLNENKNSYMMSIYKNKNIISYAYSDLSTGEFAVAEYQGDNLLGYINDQIVRVMPSEIICNVEMKEFSNNLPVLSNSSIKINEYYTWAYSLNNAEKNILSQYSLNSIKGYDFATNNKIIAIGSLLEYFKETQKRELSHLKLPNLIKDKQFMYLDTNTRRNLEIEQTMREGAKYGSLFWVLDETCTSGGARMLRSWVREPLQNKQQIDYRLDLVNSMYDNHILRANLKESLSKVFDIERLVGKIGYGNVTPKDCQALSNSIKNTPIIREILLSSNSKNLVELANKITDLTAISNLIDSVIADELPALLKDGGYIRAGFNEQLDKFNNIKTNAEQYIVDMTLREREATGIKNLKISYNKVFGYFIEVNKQFADQVPFNYIRKQTISNNERYIIEELKQLEDDILSSKENAIKLEEKIFAELKTQLLSYTTQMQELAFIISTIDCIYSLATIAYKNDYVKPEITENNNIDIVDGRHPVIEKLSKNKDFIPNDCNLNDSDQRTMILTGPNMAGKSTYMRQVALITLMAHIGSFVPARQASICIVDRIFTRIGASDDLAVGQSTFMVEMIEMANILNYATNNSLIILDEVGRGTSTFDGLSIAWAVVEYLSKKLNAKTLFATHYHELMQLEGIYDGVKNFCISIKEIGGKLVFLRKIMRGSATKSYGVEVASLAGLPNEIISRAKQIMHDIEEQKSTNTANQDSEIVNILREIDINSLTPLVAFDTLLHLKELTDK